MSWVLSGLSILCSFFILGSAWYLHTRPHTRHCVDRISFRLLCWAMAVEIIYDIMYIGIYAGDVSLRPPFAFPALSSCCIVTDLQPKGMPDKLCSGMVYLMVATMNAWVAGGRPPLLTGRANWLCTCIAINLMLIIVFHINPRHRRLERWYVVGSFIMGLGPPLVPAALNHFGKDTTPWGNCFMRDVEVHSRIVKLILDVVSRQAAHCVRQPLIAVSLASPFLPRRYHLHCISAVRPSSHLSSDDQGSLCGQPSQRVIVVGYLGDTERALQQNSTADQRIPHRPGDHQHASNE